jgi:FkbM family methyltransferase
LQDPFHKGWEPFYNSYLLKEKGNTALDIGAATGVWSLSLAHQFKTVHAYEPEKRCFNMLREKTKEVPNIICHQEAIMDFDGKTEFNEFDIIGHTVSPLVDRREYDWPVINQFEARTHRIDSLQMWDIDLIKIDVEGAEGRVLDGAKGVLRLQSPRMAIEVHGETRMAKTREVLKSCGYNNIKVLKTEGEPHFGTMYWIFSWKGDPSAYNGD